MKTCLCIVLSLLFACTLPAFVQDSSASDSDSKIKALEAELAALRAQLQAQQEIRGGDRRRAPDGRNNMQEDRRRPHNGMDRGMDREIQIDFTVDSEGDLENMPEFIRDMVMDRMGGGGENMSVMVNGREMMIGDMHDGRDRGEHHQVMQFDLGDMTDGDMDGEIHIEIMGSRDMGHLAESIPHMVMAGMMGDDRWEDGRHMDRNDDISEELMRRMNHHDLPMELLEELMEQHEIHNEHDVVIGMDMLIDRLESEGHDPGPIMELRHGFIERLEGRGEGHHDVHHEDPYMQQGGEFVAKMFLSEEIANVLSDQRAVSIFCIWEARQHLEPQERLDALLPIMINDQVDMAVRNAAAMVVRQSFYELGDRARAIETLRNQILSNEGLLN
ncbi:MAG: hypothetical protein P8L37_08835 [Phycisphaerales bacterium]|nr:hypothetical protein [Phycisphaerales bacterium]